MLQELVHKPEVHRQEPASFFVPPGGKFTDPTIYLLKWYLNFRNYLYRNEKFLKVQLPEWQGPLPVIDKSNQSDDFFQVSLGVENESLIKLDYDAYSNASDLHGTNYKSQASITTGAGVLEEEEYDKIPRLQKQVQQVQKKSNKTAPNDTAEVLTQESTEQKSVSADGWHALMCTQVRARVNTVRWVNQGLVMMVMAFVACGNHQIDLSIWSYCG